MSEPASSKNVSDLDNKSSSVDSENQHLKKSKLEDLIDREDKNSLIKKPRPIEMTTEGDSNNNTVKQVATNITYQKSNVPRPDRLKNYSRTGGQNGCTIWFTGLSCSGKTTLSFALEEYLTRVRHCVAYCLDGDNIRHGLNSNLGFSREERSENIRRIGEVSKLFTDAGIICLSSFISPFAVDRHRVREIHKKADLNFVEIYVKAPLEVCEQRDVKGLYKKARSGLIKDFTGINSEYEEPYNPEIVIETSKRSIQDCIDHIVKYLEDNGIIRKQDDSAEETEDYSARELFAAKDQVDELRSKAEGYHKLNINRVEAQWVQVLSEGWAHPLRGFMNEDDYLQCLHFNYIKRDGKMYNQSVPIVLSCSNEDADKLRGQSNVSLYFEDKLIAVMNNISVYGHRKEERCARQFGLNHQGHPYQKYIWEECGDWLVGGELIVFERIKWNDGLDEFRLTPVELRQKYKEINADAVFAFQLRNPIHNGHALLMKDTRKFLLDKGYKNPVLLLHPLGGWTKDDDAPLHTRIEQHKAVLASGEFLSPSSVIMAIFPSPMMYAGPTEVQWHAKSRLNAGANYYIVGRDPAGMPHPGDPKRGDLYDATHGSRVLLAAPGLEQLKIVPFRVAAYNKTTQSMEYFDPSRVAEFDFISGTKMRKLAREGALPPDGFMVPAAWNVLADYYKNLK